MWLSPTVGARDSRLPGKQSARAAGFRRYRFQAKRLTVQSDGTAIALLDQSEELTISQLEGREELFERNSTHVSAYAVLRTSDASQLRQAPFIVSHGYHSYNRPRISWPSRLGNNSALMKSPHFWAKAAWARCIALGTPS